MALVGLIYQGVAVGINAGVESFTRCPRKSTKTKQENFPFRKIAIRAPNGNYLKALGGGKDNWLFDWQSEHFYTGVIKAEATAINDWEKFTVHPCDGSSLFALQSHHGGFLCAENGVNDVTANRNHVGEWETFQFTIIEKNDGNTSWTGYFQTFNQTYLTINHEHSHFTANTTKVAEAAIFEVLNMDYIM
mmetsp:Transcript_30324/g.28969  ORF Transcript_30324/g.28969 Transcript_30324/m.28969 type:complete len:190 (+) Transcript_30324:333-902(+)